MHRLAFLAFVAVTLAGCATPEENRAMTQAYFDAYAKGYRYQPPTVQPVVYPTMATPQVAPLNYPGGNQVRCISTGIYTNCRY